MEVLSTIWSDINPTTNIHASLPRQRATLQSLIQTSAQAQTIFTAQLTFSYHNSTMDPLAHLGGPIVLSSSGAAAAIYPTQAVTPLASLTPDTTQIAVIYAAVTLIWPYSASTSTFRLVLAEEDFRLRRYKGHLHVKFHGACAAELNKLDVQIGDRFLLSLAGGSFRELEGATAKDVPWVLVYNHRLCLKVRCMPCRLNS